MFKNPGDKIQSIATWIMAIGIIVAFFAGIGGYGEKGVVYGILMGVLALIGAYVGSLALYAIGSAVDDIQKIRESIERIEKNGTNNG